ncbi:hypothetical protein P12x_004872 [Tundrisphaera lichenicola]|uniref:hypothetical protein n=1 Tax=Tundrisphaera lichenicola TaxID=2029860 RepID=UPI003EBFB5B1
MSRAAVLGCILGLMCAGPLCQADAASAFMATVHELDDPGTVDPVDPPRDHPGDNLVQKVASVETVDLPSFLDGPVSAPGLDLPCPTALRSGRDFQATRPWPWSARARLSLLQVYRN